MRLIITDNVGKVAATYVKESINKAKKDFVLGLPTGGSAVTMYKNLVEMYKKKEISFKNVTTFNMDEYIGLPKEHSQSYHTFMHENIFNHVDMDKSKINIPNGLAKDIPAECKEYEERIKKAGGVDLFVGGVGENGHIAFNEPYSSLSSRTRDKQLEENTIIANSRFFDGDIKQVPTSAITVGTQTIMDSKEVLILINGEKKAFALKQLVEGAVSHSCPITILQMHPRALIIVDEAACVELKVRTYKYFKELKDEYSWLNS